MFSCRDSDNMPKGARHILECVPVSFMRILTVPLCLFLSLCLCLSLLWPRRRKNWKLPWQQLPVHSCWHAGSRVAPLRESVFSQKVHAPHQQCLQTRPTPLHRGASHRWAGGRQDDARAFRQTQCCNVATAAAAASVCDQLVCEQIFSVAVPLEPPLYGP